MERADKVGDKLRIVGDVLEPIDRGKLAGQVERNLAERGFGIKGQYQVPRASSLKSSPLGACRRMRH